MGTHAFLTSFPSAASRQDDSATHVLRRLEGRPAGGAWGLLKTVLLGVPSFGILPLLAYAARFQQRASEDARAMNDLARWAKARGRRPAAIGPLLVAAQNTSPSPVPFLLAVILSVLVVAIYANQFTQMPLTLDRLLSWTYSVDYRISANSPLSAREFAYRVWVISLGIGYAVQWLNIRDQTQQLKRFVERFNPIVEAASLPPVRFPTRGHAAFRPIWILAGIILALYGAWWGIPMVLAGMAQKRYTNVTSRVVRQELAKRVKDMTALRQMPAVTMNPSPQQCANPRCRAILRRPSRFCSRCGTPLPEARNP